MCTLVGVSAVRRCETRRVSDRPRVLATLEGYAIEGGFDRRYCPSTCYSPKVALGRVRGPDDAEQLWRDYERVLAPAAALGLDGIRLTVEWARVEPRRGEVDESALERYAEVVLAARALGLDVTIALVDTVWPSWLGLECWLLPWTVDYVVAHAHRVVQRLGAHVTGVVDFTAPDAMISNGFLLGTTPPWRTRASADATDASAQVHHVRQLLAASEVVGPRLVTHYATLSLDQSFEEFARVASTPHLEEIYVRALVRGSGPTAAPAGLLERRDDGWVASASSELLVALL